MRSSERGARREGGGAKGTGKVERVETLGAFQEAMPRLLAEEEPHFVVLPVTSREPLPPVHHSNHAERILKLAPLSPPRRPRR